MCKKNLDTPPLTMKGIHVVKNALFFFLIFVNVTVCLYSTYKTHYSDTSVVNQQMAPSGPLISESVITMQKRTVKAALLGRSGSIASSHDAVSTSQPSIAQKASASIFEYFNTKFEHVCTIFNNVIKLFSDDIREYIRAFDYMTGSDIRFLIPLSKQLQMEYEEFLAEQEALAQAALEKSKPSAPQEGAETGIVSSEVQESAVPSSKPVVPQPPPATIAKKFKNDFFIYNFNYQASGPLHKGFQGFRASIDSAVGISLLYKPLLFAFKKARFEHIVVISGANEFWLKVFALIYNAKDKKVSDMHCAAQMLMLCWRLSKTQGVETLEKAYEAHAVHLLQFFKTISFQGMDVTAFVTKCYALSTQLRSLESEVKVSAAVLNDFELLTKKVIAFILGMLEKYDRLLERGLEKKESRIRDLYKAVQMKDLQKAVEREEAFKMGKDLHGLLDGWHDFMQLLSKKVESLLSASPLYKQQPHAIDAVYLEVLDPFLSRVFITWHDIRPPAPVHVAAGEGGGAPQPDRFSFDLMKEMIQ